METNHVNPSNGEMRLGVIIFIIIIQVYSKGLGKHSLRRISEHAIRLFVTSLLYNNNTFVTSNDIDTPCFVYSVVD